MSVSDRGRGPSVLVIGAGMAGLAAAWQLQHAGLDVTVVERETRPGGRIRTEHDGDLAFDTGAQFLATFYPRTLRLINDLGIQSYLVRIPGGAAILHAGSPHPVWPLRSMRGSRLLSLEGKLGLLRLGLSLLRHWRTVDVGELHRAQSLDTGSMAEYARRHLGEELSERVIYPGVEGFLYSTPERTSQVMLLALAKAGVGLRALFTLRGGLGQLPQAMAAKLSVTYGAEVRQVRTGTNRCSITISVNGREHRTTVDAVVCATKASAVPQLFPDVDDHRRAFFAAVNYLPQLAAAVFVRRRLPTKLYTLLFPRHESRYLACATIESAKHPSWEPDRDVVLLYSRPTAITELMSDDDLTVRDKLLADLGRAGPSFQLTDQASPPHIRRWEQALPEFGVGYVKRLRRFADGEIEPGRVVFAGDYLGGPSVEGAVASGQQAASRLLGRLHQGRSRSVTSP
jgi:protoporphyrinogen/coproporphyrinogen III oxidase